MKIFRALLLPFFLSALSWAQVPTTTLAGIAHVAIRVSDLTRSRDFYQKLGFEQAFTLTKDGKITQAFLKINDRQFIEIYPQEESSPAPGFMHICFESTDLGELRSAYVAHSLSPTAVKRGEAGNLLFTLAAPEDQNIEFTQYMTASLYSKDRGQHLGANRISTQIFGFSLRTEDTVAARTFYEQMLGFHESRNPLEQGLVPLLLPGTSGQVVEITPGAYQILFSVPSLRRAASQLSASHIAFQKQASLLTVEDPDGNRIGFLSTQSETGWRLPQIPWLKR